MRLFSLAALVGLAGAISNVSYWGAPRFTIGDTLPNLDGSGHVVPAGTLEGSTAPSCGQGSRSASNGHSVAYYQAWNVRTRKCDKIWPSQINTAGLTHLNLAFASIDPKSYKIRLQNEGDADVYRQFTALKAGGVQTWLGVGGWEFSDEGETRTTWSELAASLDNRKAFISSAIDMLDVYGFQGLDVDWEWPTASSRGGRPDDKKNHVCFPILAFLVVDLQV
jgi:chitinase